jgi:hypothetical protein
MKVYYRLSKNKRKYSPDPIVRVTVDDDGKEEEEVTFISTMRPKEVADAFSLRIVNFLNQNI